MEKITCLTDNNEPVVFFVLEQTRINGKNYLLVTDVEDENVDAASSEEVDDEVPDGADTEDSEGGAEEADAEPEESAEANEQEDEAAKETEEGESGWIVKKRGSS